MNLGNFFDAVGTDQVVPVVPRPIDIVLTCTSDMLPNGKPNPGGRPIRGRGKACMVPLTPREIVLSRARARKLLAGIVEPLTDPETKMPPRTGDNEEEIAVRYEQIASFLRQWDPAAQIVGAPLFPSAETALDFLSYEESTRIMVAYNDYMKEEHPTEVDQSTRNKSKGPSGRLAPAPPR